MRRNQKDYSRRSFLAKTGMAVSASFLSPKWIFAQQPAADETVERVHVIFKTHLDIGFTDMADNVIKTYFEQFIPNVLSLTEQIAREGKKYRYQWTTGSWLVYRYLEEASPENKRRMESAIERGDFFWHGLPFTTHSELIDKSLFRLSTSYSASLDQRFGRKTIAAKMTDVPGHTRGILPVMADAGIELFHVGVNTASAIPAVPSLFVWKSSEGKELTMMYDHDYGGVTVLPDKQTAVSISFTEDNLGPHTPEQIETIYDQLRKRFPNAEVFASNLNAVAADLRLIKHQLPVITQEIGDTWIHGSGSDPLMIARFRELSRLRKEWISKGNLVENSMADMEFGKFLLCIPEHTWGIGNTQSHPDIYEMADFCSSRKLPEFKRMDESWEQKRAFIDKAVSTLSPELQAEANQRLKSLQPKRPDTQGLQNAVTDKHQFDTKHFRIGFDKKNGAVNFLQQKSNGTKWAGPSQSLGLFTYQTFSKPEFDRFMEQYVPSDHLEYNWVLESWNKKGLEKSSAKSALFVTTLKKIWHEKQENGESFIAQLEIPEARDSGCPKEILVETFLPDNEPVVRTTLKWFNKSASRLPEACWFSFVPPVLPNAKFVMDKMGEPVSPLDVVKDGNRNMHGVISGVTYEDKQKSFQLETLDAFLVSPGRRSLLFFDNQKPDMDGGLHFCLFNNLTGTNFRMWFEEDMQFRFTMRFS